MRGDAQSYLELAVDYGNCGLWDEAIDVLSRVAHPEDAQAKVFPMVYYYLGYYSEMANETTNALRYYGLAAAMPTDYCFPFRWESLDVLHEALKSNPRDTRAYYYLGSLLYDSQPEKAIRAWEASRELDDTFALLHRNLALAYAQVESKPAKALASMRKAVALNPKDARFLFESDQLAEAAGVAPENRLAELESRQAIVLQRDDAVQQETLLYVELGQYDKHLTC